VDDLNRHVKRQGDLLINLVTKEALPENADQASLSKGFFLKGQEQEAVNAYLFRTPRLLQVTVIPTWSCNLRCPHCFVLHQLDNRSGHQATNVDKLTAFFERYKERYPDTGKSLLLVGGEPLENPDGCRKALEAFEKVGVPPGATGLSSITTNLTKDLSESDLELLDRIDGVNVSVDGDEEYHNGQRLSVDGAARNNYRKTLRNIKRLVDRGMGGKLTVSMTIDNEMWNDRPRMLDCLSLLIYAGVKPENINIGSKVPTERLAFSKDVFKKSLAWSSLRDRTCCSFRHMENFVIHGDKLSADYFDVDGTVMGTLDDDLDVIESRYRRYVVENMAVLHDDVCGECDMLGVCWGYCTSCDHGTGKSPSKFCNAPDKRFFVEELLAKGDLLGMIRRNEVMKLGRFKPVTS
jgi:radical SAM protein with 4Fe4S-binding SPASM domain